MKHIIFSILLAAFLSACGTNKITRPDGSTETKTNDSVVAEQAAKAAGQCVEISKAVAKMDSHAQVLFAAGGGCSNTDFAAAYYNKEKEKVKQYGGFARSLLNVSGLAYIGGKLVDAGADIAKNSGTTYNTNMNGDVTANAGSGGGGEGGGGAGGNATINLGGQQSTDGATLVGRDAPYLLRDSTYQGNEKGNIGDGDVNDNDGGNSSDGLL